MGSTSVPIIVSAVCFTILGLGLLLYNANKTNKMAQQPEQVQLMLAIAELQKNTNPCERHAPIMNLGIVFILLSWIMLLVSLWHHRDIGAASATPMGLEMPGPMHR